MTMSMVGSEAEDEIVVVLCMVRTVKEFERHFLFAYIYGLFASSR